MDQVGDHCASCGTTVGLEEIAQGLAVKVSGKLMCPLCVDHLPGDAKVHINQMRALRGLAVTTYRVFSPRHPGLHLFSFTTSNLLIGHRRQVVRGEVFHAPPLPPAGSRPRLPTAAEASKGERAGWLIVTVVATLIIAGLSWLLIPGAQSAKPTPPAVTTPVVVLSPPDEPTVPAQPTPTRSFALQLNDLERRLREQPATAADIARSVELLTDDIPPRELLLHRRANELALAAAALIPRPEPAPIIVEPPVIPLVDPPISQPVPASEPPASNRTDTKPTITKPVPTAPVEPVTETPPTKAVPPAPPVTPQAIRDRGPERLVVRIAWPAKYAPLIPAHSAVPTLRERLPWPWPSRVNIWAGAPDEKNRGKGVALELHIPELPALGGVTIVMHPNRPIRNLAATWMDGSTTRVRVLIAINEQRWQTVCIPATGIESLNASSLSLRIEDTDELPPARPFLIAGATLRAGHLPEPGDCHVQLPLIDPLTATGADGRPLKDIDFHRRLVTRPVVADGRFTVLDAKVLLYNVESDRDFVHMLSGQLSAILNESRAGATLRTNNPANLPIDEAEFADHEGGWPGRDMADISNYKAVVVGWRDQGWGKEASLGTKIELVLAKFLTARVKPKRSALLPILAIGEINRATVAEQTQINRIWDPIAISLVAKGIPVIDLRSAQVEATADGVRAASSLLIADALRQLDWLIKTYRK